MCFPGVHLYVGVRIETKRLAASPCVGGESQGGLGGDLSGCLRSVASFWSISLPSASSSSATSFCLSGSQTLSPAFRAACCLTSKVVALFVLHLQEPRLVSSSCPSQLPLKFTMSSFLSFSNEFSLLLFHSSLISHLMFLSDLLLASCPFPLLINLFVLHVHGSRLHTPRLNVQLKLSGCSSVRALGSAGLGVEDGTIVVVCLETSCLTLLA